MSKRYQWLKMDQGFFQSKHIKKLRQLGVEQVLVYTKLMLLSIKHDGKVFHSGIEDTLSEELALDIDEDAAVVEEVLHFMARYNLIKELPDSTYEIVEAVECLGKADLSTPRVEKSRAKKKAVLETLLETNETLHETVETNCNVSSLLHETDVTNVTVLEKSRVEVEKSRVEKEVEKTSTSDSEPIDRLTAIYVSAYESRWQSPYRKIKKPVNWPEFVYEMTEDEFEKIAVKHVLDHISEPDKSTVEYFATAVNRYRQV